MTNELPEETSAARVHRLIKRSSAASKPATANVGASSQPHEEKSAQLMTMSAPSPAGEMRDKTLPNTAQPDKLAAAPATSARPEPVAQTQLGDILWLDDGTVVVYRQPVPNQQKEYAYQLAEKGALEVRSLVLAHYHPRLLGRLNSDLLRLFIRDKHWVRDAVLYHLDHWSFGRYLPSSNGSHLNEEPAPDAPAPDAQEPALNFAAEGALRAANEDIPAALQDNPNAPPTLRRGVQVTIRHGVHAWEAVYWGRNDKGDIVAHRTAQFWQLAHVDLKHFGDQVEIGAVLSEQEINDIADAIMPNRK
ncbi:MAG: hypothetical protein NTX50_10965 [Candidatus Sumerlaeota bacterium]|nr:hypothetical protein [Candidatus Sumerlaeota bacterium]